MEDSMSEKMIQISRLKKVLLPQHILYFISSVVVPDDKQEDHCHSAVAWCMCQSVLQWKRLYLPTEGWLLHPLLYASAQDLLENCCSVCLYPIAFPLMLLLPSIRGTQRQFSENICSEDDLRPRIFGTFVVKFLACQPLLGFSNI